MSTQRLIRSLIPIAGPGIRDRVWIIRYTPTDKAQSDFFRIFVDWVEMLDSMSLPVELQHPMWQHPFEIFMIDFETAIVQEISEEVMRLIEARRKQDERTREEHNNERAD